MPRPVERSDRMRSHVPRSSGDQHSRKILIHGKMFAASQTIPAQRASKLLLTLGNTSMQMKVNGRQVTVPPSATSIGFLLVPTGYRPLPVSKQPRCA